MSRAFVFGSYSIVVRTKGHIQSNDNIFPHASKKSKIINRIIKFLPLSQHDSLMIAPQHLSIDL